MSRFYSAAGVAAIAMVAATTVFLAEPGLASDLGADIAAPKLLISETEILDDATVMESTQTDLIPTQGPAGELPTQDKTEVEPLVSASSLAELVTQTSIPSRIDAELRCLASTVYFEARGESLKGQLAVAHVVINRAESGRFPTSLCGVVYQPSQFSFIRSGKMPRVREGRQWTNAVAIAQIAMEDSWKNHASGALYFHARHVSPNWGKKRIAQIDNHIFYR
jgi:spore germination cell wall hydrolase CwlJ-like protein